MIKDSVSDNKNWVMEFHDLLKETMGESMDIVDVYLLFACEDDSWANMWRRRIRETLREESDDTEYQSFFHGVNDIVNTVDAR